MIRLQKLSLTRGTKPLLDGADLTLNPGEKVGLIGANGSGKSSLFALLRGELTADGGAVDFPATWRISHVAQETPALDRPALEYVIDGDGVLRDLEAQLAAAEAAHDGERIGYLHAALADADAYTVRSRAEILLAGLGFAQSQMMDPVASFSGGWRMRLGPDEPVRPAAAGRADQPSGPRRHPVAGRLAQALSRHADRDLARPRFSGRRDQRHRAPVRNQAQTLRRQLLGLREAARHQPLRRAGGVRKAVARAGAPEVLHRPLQGQGQQGPPGAVAHEDAGQDGGTGADPRHRRLQLRVSRTGTRPQSAAGTGRRRRRLSVRAAGRPGEGHPVAAEPDPAGRAAHWPFGRQRRRQVHADQDPGRRTAAAGRQRQPEQGPVDRLLRPASDRNAAPGPDAAVAFGQAGAQRARTATAQFPGRLQLHRRDGHDQGRHLLRRREGAPGAGADRLATPQPAGAGRTDESPGP